MTRQHSATAYNGLRTAWKLLVAACGGVEATAAAVRVKKTLVSDYGNINIEGRFVPVDVVMDVESLAGRPLITQALARAQGCELVAVEAKSASTVALELARIGRDIGDLFANAARLLNGDGMTDQERAAIVRDLQDARMACSAALQLIDDGAPMERAPGAPRLVRG